MRYGSAVKVLCESGHGHVPGAAVGQAGDCLLVRRAIGHDATPGRRSGLLPLLAAIVNGRRDFDPGTLDGSVLEHALRSGLGAWIAAVSKRDHGVEKLHGAALAQRVLGETMMDALQEILAAANRAGCRPLLLKGAASALRYHPRPELRAMGDLDLLVPAAMREAVEGGLRRLGYVQRSELSESFYDGHFHSMPFWNPRQQVWVDVHTRPAPETSHGGIFDAVRVLAAARPFGFRDCACLVMPIELELAYLCTRWVEELDTERGLWPLLDVALLIRVEAANLEWDAVMHAAASDPVLAAAQNLMLGYLDRTGLAALPPRVLVEIARHDRITNRATRAVLWRILDEYLIGGRPFGRLVTESNVSLVWNSLLIPRRAALNLCALPVRLAFPPGQPIRLFLARASRGLLALLPRRPF